MHSIGTHPGHGQTALGGRARRVALGLGLSVVLGGLSLTTASPSASAQDRHPASSLITARDFGTAANAIRPARSHRLAEPAALLSIAFSAAIAVWLLESGRRHAARRRVEQFFARRRGPPLLLVAH